MLPDFFGSHDGYICLHHLPDFFLQRHCLKYCRNIRFGFYDHSGFLYLMDREGRLGALLSHNSGPDEIAAKIRELLDQG